LWAGLLPTSCLLLLASGCASHDPSRKVIFLDGAGNFGAGARIERGLRAAGYDGAFDHFVWTSFLLWGADHLVAARSDLNANRLADDIQKFRRAYPDGYLVLMGLSAGTAVITNALSRLPEGVEVDAVVFFQPSISADADLSAALPHIRHKLYATCSGKDLILSGLLINADGGTGAPAGLGGVRVPRGLPEVRRRAYSKVVNLPWQEKYDLWGWNGGHIGSTAPEFVRRVIYPRAFQRERTPGRRVREPQISADGHR
jgi:pimeloyl-ACP methyl ester carboxylesterase